MLILIFLHHGHIIDSHYSFLPPFVQFASGSSPTPPPVPLLYTQSLLNNVNNGFPNRFIPNTHHHHSQTPQQIPFLHFKSEFFILSISRYNLYSLVLTPHLFFLLFYTQFIMFTSVHGCSCRFIPNSRRNNLTTSTK